MQTTCDKSLKVLVTNLQDNVALEEEPRTRSASECLMKGVDFGEVS